MIILNHQDVVGLIQKKGLGLVYRELMEALVQAYQQEDRFDLSPRHTIGRDMGVMELMPTATDEWYSCKYVNGHLQNTLKGLPTVCGMGFLADVQTGVPVLLSDLTLLTAIRTAAMTAVVAKQCVSGHQMGMLGAGAQAEFQVLAMKEALGIQSVSVYDPDKEACDKLRRNLESEVEVLIQDQEAVLNHEVLVTVTNKEGQVPLFSEGSGHLKFIAAVGGDAPGKQELPEALVRDSQVVVQYLPQTRVEGEIQYQKDHAHVMSVSELMNGRSPERDRVVFDSVGFSIEDYVVMVWLYQQVKGKADQDFFRTLDDPKNLYATIG